MWMRCSVTVALCMLAAGCQLAENAVHNVTFEARVNCTEMRDRCKYEKLARESWRLVTQNEHVRTFSKDYADGFKEGFVDYLEFGGAGQPPYLPPKQYWGPHYRTPDGHRAIEDWYAGFAHGASMAQQSGYRDYVTLPSAHAAEAAPPMIGPAPAPVPTPAPIGPIPAMSGPARHELLPPIDPNAPPPMVPASRPVGPKLPPLPDVLPDRGVERPTPIEPTPEIGVSENETDIQPVRIIQGRDPFRPVDAEAQPAQAPAEIRVTEPESQRPTRLPEGAVQDVEPGTQVRPESPLPLGGPVSDRTAPRQGMIDPAVTPAAGASGPIPAASPNSVDGPSWKVRIFNGGGGLAAPANQADPAASDLNAAPVAPVYAPSISTRGRPGFGAPIPVVTGWLSDN